MPEMLKKISIKLYVATYNIRPLEMIAHEQIDTEINIFFIFF